ncbi:glycosyltransferase [Bizionia gelidisalsuginis]|uniref:Glycosyltransferase n=2 Tax=Bizionia TaxID=283785 RepID=A0A8H2LGA8_9FLAO|nr:MULTISPECIES: TIGR04282 family arsenosugar biosynthesis glycosyltransferase [Bizionia]TYB78128.1 glycosyltransferase [Bizionia saleffrena]TYC12108.1 glycosyltransferase [Bizionia gelidisalsuginis]
MKTKTIIITFTRNPELGKCKTRLAKTIGDAAALRVYRFLIAHTESVLSQIESDKAVYYSEQIRDNDIWEAKHYQKHLQKGADLGVRMLNAFENAFKANYLKVIIVGSDLYNLKPSHINDALLALDTNDAVIGPAEDGGYYLLGLKTLNPIVFKNKEWGTETVFRDTMIDLKNSSVHTLETLNDIDVYEDLVYNSTLQNIIAQND